MKAKIASRPKVDAKPPRPKFFLLLFLIVAFCLIISFILSVFLKPTKGEKVELTLPAGADRSQQSNTIAVLKNDVIVFQPASEAIVASPLVVAGRAKALKSTIYFRLKNQWGEVIATAETAVKADDSGWGDYNLSLEFPQSASPAGTLEIYTKNSATGAEQDLIKLPLTFKDFQPPKVSIYFSKPMADSATADCSRVYLVERQIEPTNQLLSRAIQELFKGPTEEERKSGLVSNLPLEGVKVQKFEYKDGIVYIDFNGALQQGISDACRLIAIRAQITENLKSFPQVKDVVISLDGETEGVLE